jgi:hypothetical protein
MTAMRNIVEKAMAMAMAKATAMAMAMVMAMFLPPLQTATMLMTMMAAFKDGDRMTAIGQ